jgi:hypothetical protein
MKQAMRYLKVEDLTNYSTISVEEAAHVAGIGRATAYKAISNGDFFEVVVVNKAKRVLAQPLFIKLMGTAVGDGVPT